MHINVLKKYPKECKAVQTPLILVWELVLDLTLFLTSSSSFYI